MKKIKCDEKIALKEHLSKLCTHFKYPSECFYNLEVFFHYQNFKKIFTLAHKTCNIVIKQMYMI